MSASLQYYEPGLRSGAWRKMRVNRTQDFVIGGYAQINVLACPWHLSVLPRNRRLKARLMKRNSLVRYADFPTTEEESVNNWGVARDLIWLGPIPPTNLVWEVAYPNAPCQQVPQSGVQQLCL